MPGPGPLPGRGRHRARSAAFGEPRGKSWARLVLLSVGVGVSVLLLILPFFGGDETEQDVDIPMAAGTSAGSGKSQLGVLESMLTASPSESVTSTPDRSPTESATPTSTGSPSKSATPSPSKTTAPKPELLGPDSSGGLANMVQRYCDRHVGGGSADARSDGRWQCTRFLASDPIVDMDVACSDTYGSGAYAQNSGGGAYGWRCYRKS